MFVGTPVALVVSAIGLFKDEKKLLAIAGLIISALAVAAFFLGWFSICL